MTRKTIVKKYRIPKYDNTELEIMAVMASAITELPDDETRQRVLWWIGEKFGPLGSTKP